MFFSSSPGTHHCGKRFIKIPFSPLLFLQQHVFIHPEHTTATKDSKKKYLVKTFVLKTKCLHSPGIHHCGKRFKEKYKKYSLKKDPVCIIIEPFFAWQQGSFLPGNKKFFWRQKSVCVRCLLLSGGQWTFPIQSLTVRQKELAKKRWDGLQTFFITTRMRGGEFEKTQDIKRKTCQALLIGGA